VRGYDFGSFDANDAIARHNSCEAFDRLNGSRVAVASAELRFPLLGLFSRKSFYGAFPIEMALFADAGLAWTSTTKPPFAGGDRDWAGAPAPPARQRARFRDRRIDYVRPLDRSRKGWLWQFGLTPDSEQLHGTRRTQSILNMPSLDVNVFCDPCFCYVRAR
jgi:outer membrane protein assembly factor BamA